MSNATRLWNSQDAGDGLSADCTGVASATAATCNGSGDGMIANTASGDVTLT